MRRGIFNSGYPAGIDYPKLVQQQTEALELLCKGIGPNVILEGVGDRAEDGWVTYDKNGTGDIKLYRVKGSLVYPFDKHLLKEGQGTSKLNSSGKPTIIATEDYFELSNDPNAIDIIGGFKKIGDVTPLSQIQTTVPVAHFNFDGKEIAHADRGKYYDLQTLVGKSAVTMLYPTTSGDWQDIKLQKEYYSVNDSFITLDLGSNYRVTADIINTSNAKKDVFALVQRADGKVRIAAQHIISSGRDAGKVNAYLAGGEQFNILIEKLYNI